MQISLYGKQHSRGESFREKDVPLEDTSPPRPLPRRVEAWRIAGLSKATGHSPESLMKSNEDPSDLVDLNLRPAQGEEFNPAAAVVTEPNHDDAQLLESEKLQSEDAAKQLSSMLNLRGMGMIASVKPDMLEVHRGIEKAQMGTFEYDSEGGPSVQDPPDLEDPEDVVAAYWQGDTETTTSKVVDDLDPSDEYDVLDDQVDREELDENDPIEKCLKGVDAILNKSIHFAKGKWQRSDGSWWHNVDGQVVPYKPGGSGGGDSSGGTSDSSVGSASSVKATPKFKPEDARDNFARNCFDFDVVDENGYPKFDMTVDDFISDLLESEYAVFAGYIPSPGEDKDEYVEGRREEIASMMSDGDAVFEIARILEYEDPREVYHDTSFLDRAYQLAEKDPKLKQKINDWEASRS